MKLGKHPDKILKKFESFRVGLKNSLFSDIKPNNAANNIAFIAIAFFLFFKFKFNYSLSGIISCMHYNAPPAAVVRVLLVRFFLFTSTINRFGECQPPETSRIARLPARCTKPASCVGR
jgi:hypothetical protein